MPYTIRKKIGGGKHTRLTIHITLNMQLTPQHLGPTEENARFRGTMNLPYTLINHIPIRPPKVRRRSESRNSITIRIRIIDHDIRRVIHLDLRRQVRVDLNMVIHILRFDSKQQRAEPFEGAEITTDPEEIHFAETGLLLWVVHAVPDGFQDGGEGCDADSGADEHGDFEFEDVFGGGAEGAVDVDSREDAADGGVDAVCAGAVLVDGYDL